MVFCYPRYLVSHREIQYNIARIMNLHGIIKNLEQKHLRDNVADVRVGETVRVHYKIREGNKERIQMFEGLVVATKAGLSLQGSFTVRKVASGVGVERTFPLHSPWIVKIERIKTGKVRQARLNFVRKHAMSSRFKLKDKGVAGTVWEEVAKEKSEIAKGDEGQEESVETVAALPDSQGDPEQSRGAEQAAEESAETPVEEAKVEETADAGDNGADDPSTEDLGEPGGDAGSAAPAEAGAEDSEAKPQD